MEEEQENCRPQKCSCRRCDGCYKILYGTVPEESDGAHTKSFRSKEFADVKNRFFIRMRVSNEPGVLAAIAKVFGDHKGKKVSNV